MRIFKFGGASVKDAASIQNVVQVLQQVGHHEVLIVVSAMGKTTNALEEVVAGYFNDDTKMIATVSAIQKNHYETATALFGSENSIAQQALKVHFEELDWFLKHNKSTNYNFVYDQVVSYGEILSSTLLSAYLQFVGMPSQWLDVRQCIKTDMTYRDAIVNWSATEAAIQQQVSQNTLYVTQGFLGADANNFTTTLGREGSDYTAAIFAYSLNADSVTIWKDVPGVLNADPRYFENTTLLSQISYKEAIELAFYGASVIHPKTLQPLQNKEIPLYVKSFINPLLPGTQVAKGAHLSPQMPCYIVKRDQLLLSISSRDFSFIMEENISEIFSLLHQYKIKVSLIQNTAISFTICVEDKFGAFEILQALLKQKYKVVHNKQVALYTIRHATPQAIASVSEGKTILVQQMSRETMQLVTLEDATML